MSWSGDPSRYTVRHSAQLKLPVEQWAAVHTVGNTVLVSIHQLRRRLDTARPSSLNIARVRMSLYNIISFGFFFCTKIKKVLVVFNVFTIKDTCLYFKGCLN